MAADKMSADYSGAPQLADRLEAHKALHGKKYENLEEEYIIRDVAATACGSWPRRYPTDPFGERIDHMVPSFVPIVFNLPYPREFR